MASPFILLLEVFYSILSIIVVLGNVFVIQAVSRHTYLRTIPNICVTSLASVDLFVGLVNIPMYMYALYQYDPKTEKFMPNSYTIVLYSLEMYFGIASILHLAFISMERCYAVSLPLRRRFLQKGTILKILVIVWLTALIPVCLYVTGVNYAPAISTGFFFLLPLLVIIASYTLLEISAKCSQKKFKNHRINHAKKDMKLAKTLCIVVIFFILAWLPFFVTVIVSNYGNPKKLTDSDLYYLSCFVKMLHYSNSAVNPFIYAFRQREFAQALLDLFSGCKRYKRFNSMINLPVASQNKTRMIHLYGLSNKMVKNGTRLKSQHHSIHSAHS